MAVYVYVERLLIFIGQYVKLIQLVCKTQNN